MMNPQKVEYPVPFILRQSQHERNINEKRRLFLACQRVNATFYGAVINGYYLLLKEKLLKFCKVAKMRFYEFI